MGRVGRIIIAVISSFIDLATTLVFVCHGYQFQYLAKEIYQSSFKQTVIDLFVFAIFRFCLTLGLSFAILRNPTDSAVRIKASKSVIVVLCVGMCIYTVVKLLVRSEETDALKDLWFWLIFGWTILASLLLVIYVIYLSRLRVESPSIRQCNSINSSSPDLEETDPLLDKGDKSNKVTFKMMLSYSRPDLLYIIIGTIFLTISSTGQIFIPYFTGEVVDSIVIDKSYKKFEDSILIMTVISIVSSVTAGCRGWSFLIAMARLGIRIRNRLFGAVINQEIGFFDSVKTGDITSRLTSDTTVMTDTLTLNMNILARNLIQSIGIIVFMFKLSWRLSLLTLIALPIVLGISKVYGEYYRDLAKKVQDSLADANNVAEEAISSVRTVRSFANEDGEKERYRSALDKAYKQNIKQANVYAGFVWCTQLFELGLTVVILYYGGHLVLSKTLSGGNLVSFILYEMQMGECINEIGDVFTGLMQAAGASEKVFEYINREPLIQNVTNGYTDSVMGKSSGLVEFNNVTFAYPSRPDTSVLKNISFTVKPGEVVALVGPSGGGKSSCINLLEHFYEPATGEVLIDSVPVRNINHKTLHSKISLVGQEPVLYARSIKDNISYGMESDVTIETIQHAAGLANAHQFILDLKDQYETEAGEKGQQLSGGQKQRIAIARALIRKPVVLLLDEATSALDSESEHVVQQAIYNNLKGRTVIIIAHRLSTVERADRIIVIDKGRLIEQGTHAELLQKDGKYAKLVQHQLLQGEDNSLTENSDRTVTHGVDVHHRQRSLSFKSSSLKTSTSWHL